VDPFARLPTLVVLCGHSAPDGEPLPQSPDTILRRAMDRLRSETGIELMALGEVEYFLGKRRDETDIYGADDRGYHAVSPFVFGEPLRREALALLCEMGVRVKYGHSEVGYIEPREPDGVIWEQHEIELALDTLPRAADGILLAQWVLRNLSHRTGMRCSTDPIMVEGHAGNGLHLEIGAALMAFGNRAPGSLARLTQAKQAPNRITWGFHDRSALIRLPARARDAAGRAVSPATVEFRLPDGSAFPHLLLAGAALAAIRGAATADLDTLLEATAASSASGVGGRTRPVPRNFAEVAAAVAEHRSLFEAGDVFPAPLLNRLVSDLEHI
jgi:glutamine synthetase